MVQIDQMAQGGDNTAMFKTGLTVTIICHNEARNLPRVLASAAFADEIVVVDDGSSDGSAQIAYNAGAKVFHNDFVGFGQQKNFAADMASHDWILSVDADEEISPQLQKSVRETIANASHGLYSVDRHTYFLGRFIRHGGWYPDWVPRLYDRTRARFSEPKVHELLVARDGAAAQPLTGALKHYSFPSVESQVVRNLKYARLGAQDLLARKGRPDVGSVFYRPAWKFIECYFIKLGVLDGLAGLVIAINASYSLFMKYAFAYFDFTKERKRIGE